MIDWITANWIQIATIATYVIATFSIVAKLTPTETDNKILAKVMQLADILGLNTEPTKLKD